MKKFLLSPFIIIVIVMMSGISCEKLKADEYYVKYGLETTSIYSGGNVLVDITKEDGSGLPTIIVPIRQDWETTIGPVKKGFLARMVVTKSGWNGVTAENHLKLYLRIEVSKNDAPFTLKEINGSNTPRATATVEYTIQ